MSHKIHGFFFLNTFSQALGGKKKEKNNQVKRPNKLLRKLVIFFAFPVLKITHDMLLLDGLMLETLFEKIKIVLIKFSQWSLPLTLIDK